MSDRKEYMKKYRESHKEEIAKYKKEYVKKNGSSFKRLQKKNSDLQQRINKASELCKIILDNEDKNKDLLDHVAMIYRELQGKEME